jgi:hypothetical protein
MTDLAQADRTMRKTESTPGIYKVIHEDKTVIGNNLTWRQAAKIICSAYPYSAHMIRIN